MARPTLAGSGATWFLQGAIEGLAEALAPRGLRGDADRPPRLRRSGGDGGGRARRAVGYLLRRWKRVRRSIFLCFFFRMRLRRFLISEPIRGGRLDGRSGPMRTALRRAAAALTGSVG